MSIRTLFKKSRTLNFNEIYRDEWVKAELSKIPARSKVLDLGSGSCPYRPYLQHCEYFTQDFQALSPDQLRDGAYGQTDYVCDATSIPVADQSFDVVLCTEVLEHVPEPILVLQEISRILKPGGTAILTAPLGSGLHQTPYHFYGGYTPFFYRHFLQKFGFCNISVTPNKGFYAHYGQESIRCCRKLWANGHGGAVKGILLKVLALVLSPILVIFLPVLCRMLGGLERDPETFTIGFHVTAQKA